MKTTINTVLKEGVSFRDKDKKWINHPRSLTRIVKDVLEYLGVGVPTKILYSDLKALYDAGTMKVGKYEITDFRSVIMIPNTILRNIDKRGDDILEHSLIVEATTPTTLSPIAVDMEFPEDIVYYDITGVSTGTSYPADGSGKGAIYARKCQFNNECENFDFRNHVVALYAFDLVTDFRANAITYASCFNTFSCRNMNGVNTTYTALDLTDYDENTNTDGVKYHFCINNSKNLYKEGNLPKTVSNLRVQIQMIDTNQASLYLNGDSYITAVNIHDMWLGDGGVFINTKNLDSVDIYQNGKILFNSQLGYTAVGQWWESFQCSFAAVYTKNSTIVSFASQLYGRIEHSSLTHKAPTNRVSNISASIWAGFFIENSAVFYDPDAQDSNNTLWTRFKVSDSAVKFTQYIGANSRKINIQNIGTVDGFVQPNAGFVEIDNTTQPHGVNINSSDNFLNFNYDLDTYGNTSTLTCYSQGSYDNWRLQMSSSKYTTINGSGTTTWTLDTILGHHQMNEFYYIIGAGVTLTINATATPNGTKFKFKDGSTTKVYTAGDYIQIQKIGDYFVI